MDVENTIPNFKFAQIASTTMSTGQVDLRWRAIGNSPRVPNLWFYGLVYELKVQI